MTNPHMYVQAIDSFKYHKPDTDSVTLDPSSPFAAVRWLIPL